jgi:glutamate-1-semialdehyde 2,1-aminomutase
MGLVPPVEGFLELLRSQADATGALLIFDEVISGFRVARGGAQELAGVIPDLTVMGKVIGGGLPAAAYGGSRTLMERSAPAGDVYQAGTLSGNPLAVRAGCAALRTLDEPGTYEALERAGAALESGLADAARAADVPLWIGRQGSMLCPYLAAGPVTSFEGVMGSDRERWTRFFHAMLARGILLPPSPFEAWFLSTAHGPDVVEEVVAAAREAFAAR